MRVLTALAAQDSVDEFNRQATPRMGLAALVAVGAIAAAIAFSGNDAPAEDTVAVATAAP